MTTISNQWLDKVPPFTLKGNKESTTEKPQDLTVSEARQLLGISSSGYFENFYGRGSRMKNRYLKITEVPSNVQGLPIMYDSNLEGILVKCESNCSGWIRVRKNGVNLYSLQLFSQSIKITTGIVRSITAGDTLSVYVESSVGLDKPFVRLHLI